MAKRLVKQKTCSHCGERYRPWRKTSNFCSMRCTMHARGPLKAGVPYRQVAVFEGSRLGQQIRIHRLRAAKALGKPLPRGAVVHHADGSKHEDAPLVICQDHRYHLLLHRRMRIVRAGGDPDTERICCHCHQVKPFSSFAGASRACKHCDNARHSGATK